MEAARLAGWAASPPAAARRPAPGTAAGPQLEQCRLCKLQLEPALLAFPLPRAGIMMFACCSATLGASLDIKRPRPPTQVRLLACCICICNRSHTRPLQFCRHAT